jgi:hypothetical protein
LGQFPEALESYNHLTSLGDQYFRKDEMLAAAFANQALIEDYLQQASAVEIARRALDYSTDVWEVNLMCGVLLLKKGHIAEAEDAILRNLDVNLETQQSLVALLAVYHVSSDTRRLMDRLSKPEIARKIPAPLLLECVGVLGTGNIPPATLAQLMGSLKADVDHRFGLDDFRVDAAPIWQLDRAKVSLSRAGKTAPEPSLSSDSDKYKVRFSRIAELGSPIQPGGLLDPMILTVKYPETETIRIHLQEVSSKTLRLLGSDGDSAWRWPLLSGREFRIVAVDVRGKRVLLTSPGNPLPNLVMDAPSTMPVSTPLANPVTFPADETELPLVPAF